MRDSQGQPFSTFKVWALPIMVMCLNACQHETNGVMNNIGKQAKASNTQYTAQIQRTRYNIPHITAQDLPSAWFGQGYAMAEDRICVLLDQVIKVRGQRARLFGPGEYGLNIENDFAYLHLGLHANAERNLPSLPTEIRDMLVAHAAGINQYLADTPADRLPLACRKPQWRVEVTPVDLLAIATDFNIFLSGRFMLASLSAATPPATGSAPLGGEMPKMTTEKNRPGSNGWAIGAELSRSGNGMLLAQPHFPWEGSLQAWESHVTVPGEVDVYGITVPGIPNMLVGFNTAVAWTLTVTTSPKAILYDLTLVPDNPTQYLYDGKVRAMQATDYQVEVLTESGKVETKTRKLWRSHYGPMLSIPAMFTAGKGDFSWNTHHAITYRDANIDNYTLLAQFLDMSKAQGMDSFVAAHERWAGSIPFSNTVAAAATGEVWYADSSPVPNISTASYQAWQQTIKSDPGKAALSAYHGIYVLDGSTSRDEWVNDPAAKKPGLIPLAQAPQHRRKDFVFNANDSHWLTNPAKPLEGFNPLYGEERQTPSLRTRMNALALAKGVAQPFALKDLQAAALSNQSLTAQLLRADLVRRCQAKTAVNIAGERINLKQACAVLAGWDERFDLGSQGAVLFREFLGAIEESSGHAHATSATDPLFENAFDPEHPLTTPYGLVAAPAQGEDPVLLSLGRAVKTLAQAGHDVNVTLKELQFSPRNGQKIPIHGGQGAEGIMNMAAYSSANDTLLPGTPRGKVINDATGLTDQGYVVNYGTSFLLAVELTPQGPNAQAVMSFSQSADPASAHYADQTVLFSQKNWRPCLFKQADIQADSALRTYQVERLVK